MMALIVALAAFAVVASASLYVGLTVQRKLRDIEDTANAVRDGYGVLNARLEQVNATLDQFRNETQGRLATLERATPTEMPARYASEADLVAANGRIDHLVTLVEYGERAAMNGFPRYMFPGTVKVNVEDRREAMRLYRAYLATLGAVSLLPEDNADPWRRRVKVAYTHGLQTLYGELRANVLRALNEPDGPLNPLLHAIKRQASGGLQIGPLVAVRAEGEFVGALFDDESEMDEFHRLKLLDRPDMAWAYLRKAPTGQRFDLCQMPPPPGPNDP
jgi:hypothetical protein